MKLVQADLNRHLEIAGVPNPVRRPVDIDKAQTGFATLRSLRIYRFVAGSEINGHAEEDEVLIVVIAGSVALTLIDNNFPDSPQHFDLSAASDAGDHPCAAYLPPHGAYRLTPRTDADVAYARATPADGPPPKVFNARPRPADSGVALLLEEVTYPRLLRVRLLRISARLQEIAVQPIDEGEEAFEAWIHVRTVPEEQAATITTAGALTTPLTSWDTVCVTPGERPTLRVAVGSSALVLIVFAL